MHDEKRSDRARSQDANDWMVLMTVLDDRDEGPWSIAELIRDRGTDDDNPETEITDSINRLERGGLIHRTAEGLIFPTRAAVYFQQIVEQTG